MAYSDKEIIKKIEAEARIIKPKVLGSKRSAFLNKDYKCSEVSNLSAPPKTGRQVQHWFKICSLYVGNNPGGWQPVPLPNHGNVYRCFSWFQNPLNSSYPNDPQEAFYQYMIQNMVDQNTGTVGVSQLNSGEQVTLNLGPSPSLPIGPPPYGPPIPSGGDEGPYNIGVCILSGYGKAFKACVEYMGFTTDPSVNDPGSTALFHGFITSASSPPFTFRINQFCCGTSNCSSPCVVLSLGHGARTNDDLFITDLSNGFTTSYSHPQIENGEIAKFGNKFWIHCKSPNEFREFELNSNCTATYIRTINIDPSMYTSANVGVNTVNGLTAKDDNTLIIGSVDGTIGPGYSTGTLMEVDISGSTAVFTPLFQTSRINGDLIYIPSNSTIVTTETLPTGLGFVCVHYSSSGAILGQASVSGGSEGYGMFCYEGKVIINTNAGTKWFDLDTYAVQPYPLNIMNAGDQASSSSCCDTSAQPSGECYDIGDTGPEGGTIFAVPLSHPQNNGVNQTNFYYEVAKNDIAIGGTPSDGFNLTCGDAFTTSQSVPNVAVNGITLVTPGTYSVNIGDEITSLTPGLFPPGTTIASIMSMPPGLTGFTASNPANFTGPPHTIILTSTQLVSGWSASGAEWGVHNKPNITTSWDFGTGHKNTDEIDAYPLSPGNPTGGIHPWLDTHDIAATLCKQTEGWFLPSYQEFREMVDASVAHGFNLGLNTSTQFSENYYWTSSHRLPPSTVLPNPHKYAWAYNTDTNNLELAYRCHALSVRPIRRFECEPEPPPPPPCVGCGCVEYNYRERGCGGMPGVSCTASSDIDPYGQNLPVAPSNQVHYTTGLPDYSYLDNIGGDFLRFECNATDVLGNSYTFNDFQNDSQGYIITVWAKDYTFIGKWKYDNFHINPVPAYPFTNIQTGLYVGNSSSSSDRYNLCFQGVTHLEGNYPFVTWSTTASTVAEGQAFFKLESAATSTSSFASGCSSLMWGNNTMDPYLDWPAACISINPAHQWGGQNKCVTWDGLFPPLDINGNAISVEVGSNSCYYTNGSYFYSCASISNHCFSVCAVRLGGLGWYAVPDPWFGGEPYGPIAMENNPQGTTSPPFSSNPPVDQDYTDFYDWIITQIPTLVPGDSFIYEQPGYLMQFSVTDPNTGQTYTSTSVDAVCFEYRGIQTYLLPLSLINDGYSTPNIIDYYCCRSSGPSSLMKPAEDDPRSIKLKVNAKTPTKRQRFIKNKQPKNTGPFGIFGYYPLYDNIDDAIKNSPKSSYHIHDFGGQEYYMPEGLEMGITQFHGDWEPRKPEDEVYTSFEELPREEQQIIIQPEQQRIIPPEEPVVRPEQRRVVPPREPEEPSSPRESSDTGY